MEHNNNDIRPCEPDDPNRCQATSANGQCTNLSVKNGRVCLVHGGNKVIEKQNKDGLKNYRLTKYSQRVSEFSNSSHIKDIRDEIGILRILLEEKFNACANQNELLLQASHISELIMKINTLVSSCHKLETLLGLVLDKATVVTIAEQTVAIISKYVKDANTLDDISNEIMDIIEKSSEPRAE